MEINLLVIKSKIPDELAEFYSLLGIQFHYHQHGKSVLHYSGEIGQMVFEIYPLNPEQDTITEPIRLGFKTEKFDEILEILATKKISFTTPKNTEFGFLTLLSDPEGRKIELYKA